MLSLDTTNYKKINSKSWSWRYQIHHTGPNATRVLVSYREVPSPYQAQSTTTSQQGNQGHTYQLVSSIRPQGLITLGQGRTNKTWGLIGIRVPGYAPQWSRTKIVVSVRKMGHSRQILCIFLLYFLHPPNVFVLKAKDEIYKIGIQNFENKIVIKKIQGWFEKV